jgi:uncharacterized protein YdcH (DUF465 family)
MCRFTIPSSSLNVMGKSNHFQQIYRTVMTSDKPKSPKISQRSNAKEQRIERILANRGVGTRSEVSKLFKQQRVSVKGKVVLSGADKYPTDTVIEIDNDPIHPTPILALYHKPVGIHSTMSDPWGRSNLEDLSLEYPFIKFMHPVGRLGIYV